MRRKSLTTTSSSVPLLNGGGGGGLVLRYTTDHRTRRMTCYWKRKILFDVTQSSRDGVNMLKVTNSIPRAKNTALFTTDRNF